MPSTTRQALLQALSAAGGAYISGQQLAGQLGVSRAAVHKAAAALTAQGYALEAVSRRGYRLLGGDPFCAEAVGPYPAPVQVYDTLESSNRTAKLLRWTVRPTARWCSQPTRAQAGDGWAVYLKARPGRACTSRYCCAGGPGGQRPDGHHRGRRGGVPGGTGAVRAGTGHQVGQRPVLSGQKGVRHPHRSRHRSGERAAGVAGGGHRPEPDRHRRRLAPGAGRKGRQPVPGRPRPREPGRAGRGHRPAAAGPLPRL